MKHLLTPALLLLALLLPATASAYDFEVNGIYYNIIDSNEVEVTESPNHNYTGSVTIPDAVTQNGNSYTVTSIGGGAFSGCTGLTSINIPNSVTLISHHAFSGCTGLTSLIIPNSVTTIYDTAFWGCTGLTSIDISNSLTFIVHMVFFGCTGLTSINIPNSVTGIGSHAFSECTGLTSIDIPNSVTDISDGAFAGCNNLSTIVCHATIPPTMDSSAFSESTYNNATLTVPKGCMNAYHSADGWKNFSNIQEQAYDFEVDGIYYCIYNGNEAYVISRMHPYGEQYIPSYSDDVTLPATVTHGGTTYSVTGIGSGAFWGCTGLTNIHIPNSVNLIGQEAFYECAGLTSINIPNSVTLIDEYAFTGCTGLTNLDIPNSVTRIGKGAFSWCTGLSSVNIGNSVSQISRGVFYRCSGLTRITVANDNPNYDCRDNCNAIIETASNTLVTGCQNTIIPNSVTNIGSHAFNSCQELVSINIPNSVTSIGDGAFTGCSGLTTIDIPNSVTDIYDSAFAGCNNLSTIVCHATIPPTMDSSAFSESTYNNATLMVHKGCMNAYHSSDGWKNFSNIQEQAYDFEVDGIYYYIYNNEAHVIFHKQYIPSYSGDVTIPATVTYAGTIYSVTSISDIAFWGCTGLTNIYIPNSVTRIGIEAFYECEGLTSINIPNSVTYIDESAFMGCTGLTNLDIPNSVTHIAKSAFSGCTGLSSVNIGNSVSQIGRGVFYRCSGLTRITVANDNPNYDSRDNCNAIIETASNTLVTGCQNTIIPNSVTNIGESAFQECLNLTTINIPNSVMTIDDYAFFGCNYLNDVFSYITDLTQVSIGSSVFELWNGGDYANRTLHVPYGTLAAYQADSRWSQYFGTIVEMDNSFEVDGIFYRIPGNDNTVMVIPNPSSDPYSGDIIIPANVTYDGTTYSVTSIAEQAFANCPGLTSITIPSSVTSVGKQAFMNDAAIESVTCEAMTPPVWEALDLFTANVYNHSPLFVPKGCARVYMSDQCWGQFVKIIGTGDINGDGNISVGDVTMLIGMVLGVGNSSPAADVNGDGSITVSDVTALISMVLGSH